MQPDVAPVYHNLIACHECDLLQRLPPEHGRGRVRCRRCGCVLHTSGHDAVAVPLALGLTALVLFVLSNAFPLLDFIVQGQRDTTYLLAGIRELFLQGRPLLASIVLLTTVLAPLVHIALLIYIHLPLALGRRPPGFARALRASQEVLPWSMLEIFLLGVLVAAVKLSEQATIVPGPAAWSLGLLVVVLAGAATQVHPHRLWERVR
ncbi:MAG: paraquat-inducible protein A [Chromatiaceae bacterium]|nr:paraquat-inducible protein A [Gammaproteobacteria bacterium]MCP5305532.1 paraquat-inducible protein A [Chromatiaceae bacterium]MCP5315491.1 paraquat-inducible protein A [Chromatiaceae bacterium]